MLTGDGVSGSSVMSSNTPVVERRFAMVGLNRENIVFS